MKISALYFSRRVFSLSLTGVILYWCSISFLGGQAEQNAQRINKILVQLKEAKKNAAKERFVISERELNDFIAAAIEINKPQGLRKMVMNLQDNNNFYARAFVKADEIKLEGIAGKMLRTMFPGDQLVEAEGHIQVLERKMKYDLNKTRINGMTIPPAMASELAAYLIQERPPHVDIKEPFDLPYGIADVRIEKNKLILER